MSEKKLAYDFWNTPEGIRSQKIFDMRDRIRRLEASNAALLEALKHARGFIIRYGTIKEGAGFVDSPHFNSIYEKISSAIQKERGDGK